jgi:site-specific DNA-methyltransferase (adenine-specific)
MTKRVKDFRTATVNANRHSARGLSALDNSIRKDGWIGAMTTAADGEMIAGSARLERAADIFGVEVEPLVIESAGDRPIVIVRTDIPNAQDKRAQRLALADNQIHALDLSWNVEVLAGLDADILDGLFSPAELSDLGQQWADEHAAGQPVADDPGAAIDKAAELLQKWGCATGDIWQAGPHKIICGDCREPATWERLLAGVKVNGVFTSPPYAEQRKEQYGGTPAAEYVAWWEAVQANVKAHLAADGSFFVNIKPHCEDGERVLYVFDLVLAMKREWGWRFVEELTWHNTAPAPGDWPERFKNGFEPVYQFATDKTRFKPDAVSSMKDSAWSGAGGMNHTAYGKQAGKGTYSTGLVRPSNVILASSSGGETEGHATAFPVALPDFFIRAYSDTGDVWVDPFCGSGTTLVAAHNNKRVGLGIEALPKYVAVICERLQGLGITPTRLAAGPDGT